ncbi:MAG: glycosyltransferase [Nitrososphaerota archaeon]
MSCLRTYIGEKVDVVMPTLNSVSRVGENVFRLVLHSIYKWIPVNRLLVVDDGSRDGTLDILKDFDAVILRGSGSLGKAREIGIRNVKTELFYFIDDDNLIPERFHEKMCQYIDEKTGIIFPKAIIPYDNYITRYETIIGKIRRSLGLRDVVENRGYTGASLIRTEAVRDIQIPRIARQEDKFIKSYCEKRGWKTKLASEVTVLHLCKNLPSYRTQYLEGQGLAIVGDISGMRMLFSWLLTYPKVLLAFPYVRKVKLLSEIPKMYYVKYRGYLDVLRSNKVNIKMSSI